MSDAVPLTTTAGLESAPAPSALKTLVSLALRYAFNSLGPISIAAAHFTASLIFLRTMQRADFGLFSFVFIVVPFCLSMTGALFGAALVNSANGKQEMTAGELAAYMKANLIFAMLSACVVFVLMIVSTATPLMAAIVAAYGFLMAIRWFARCHAYAIHQMPRAIGSDLVYSILMLSGLGITLFTHTLTPATAASILAGCAFFALLAFGRDFIVKQSSAVYNGSIAAFLPIWRDLARWSLLGVVSTELTANAHAYLVTFISGPKAFALLAVGSLFMRPASLVMQALPDAERPAMARAISNGQFGKAIRAMANFRVAALTVLGGTAIVAAVVMTWFPEVVLKKGYDERNVIIVICVWIVVMVVRVLRTPESVLLQAAREFRPLAAASVRSSVVSLVCTAGLLLAFGPIVSLLGVLIGDLVMTQRIFALSKAWRAQHA